MIKVKSNKIYYNKFFDTVFIYGNLGIRVQFSEGIKRI